MDSENPTGFNDELRRVCAGRCGDFGEPACYLLPELVEPCEAITPCADCLADIKAKS